MKNTIEGWVVVFLLKISPRSTSLVLVCLYFGCLAATYLTLVAPGRSYVQVWLNDVMGLIDIANRVHLGETPYKDFHLFYGPLVALLPGWGLDLGLTVGSIFGFEGLVVAAFLMMSIIVALPRRLTMAAALLVFLLVWLLSVVPLGEAPILGLISWGTFYNRQGWAALIVVLLFYVEPEGTGPYTKWLDSVVLAMLVLFEIYFKFTFAAAALGFVVVNAMVSRYNRQVSLISLLIVVSVVGMLEVYFSFHVAYLRDIIDGMGMLEDSGPKRWRLFIILSNNSAMILGSLGAVLAARCVGRRLIFDWLYAAGVIFVAIFLRTTIGANQTNGTIILVAVFVGLAELARRSETGGTDDSPTRRSTLWFGHIASLGCLFYACSFASKEVINMLYSWQDFVTKTHIYSPLPGAPKRLAGLIVPPSLEPLGLNLSPAEYMKTISDGSNLLSVLNRHDLSVLTLDMVNPFPFAVNMKPPMNGRPLFWLDDTYPKDPERLPKPEHFVGHVDYVMVPRKPINAQQLANMQRRYGAYLVQNFDVLKESEYWQLWRRRNF